MTDDEAPSVVLLFFAKEKLLFRYPFNNPFTVNIAQPQQQQQQQQQSGNVGPGSSASQTTTHMPNRTTAGVSSAQNVSSLVATTSLLTTTTTPTSTTTTTTTSSVAPAAGGNGSKAHETHDATTTAAAAAGAARSEANAVAAREGKNVGVSVRAKRKKVYVPVSNAPVLPPSSSSTATTITTTATGGVTNASFESNNSNGGGTAGGDPSGSSSSTAAVASGGVAPQRGMRRLPSSFSLLNNAHQQQQQQQLEKGSSTADASGFAHASVVHKGGSVRASGINKQQQQHNNSLASPQGGTASTNSGQLPTTSTTNTSTTCVGIHVNALTHLLRAALTGCTTISIANGTFIVFPLCAKTSSSSPSSSAAAEEAGRGARGHRRGSGEVGAAAAAARAVSREDDGEKRRRERDSSAMLVVAMNRPDTEEGSISRFVQCFVNVLFREQKRAHYVSRQIALMETIMAQWESGSVVTASLSLSAAAGGDGGSNTTVAAETTSMTTRGTTSPSVANGGRREGSTRGNMRSAKEAAQVAVGEREDDGEYGNRRDLYSYLLSNTTTTSSTLTGALKSDHHHHRQQQMRGMLMSSTSEYTTAGDYDDDDDSREHSAVALGGSTFESRDTPLTVGPDDTHFLSGASPTIGGGGGGGAAFRASPASPASVSRRTASPRLGGGNVFACMLGSSAASLCGEIAQVAMCVNQWNTQQRKGRDGRQAPGAERASLRAAAGGGGSSSSPVTAAATTAGLRKAGEAAPSPRATSPTAPAPLPESITVNRLLALPISHLTGTVKEERHQLSSTYARLNPCSFVILKDLNFAERLQKAYMETVGRKNSKLLPLSTVRVCLLSLSVPRRIGALYRAVELALYEAYKRRHREAAHKSASATSATTLVGGAASPQLSHHHHARLDPEEGEGNEGGVDGGDARSFPTPPPLEPRQAAAGLDFLAVEIIEFLRIRGAIAVDTEVLLWFTHSELLPLEWITDQQKRGARRAMKQAEKHSKAVAEISPALAAAASISTSNSASKPRVAPSCLVLRQLQKVVDHHQQQHPATVTSGMSSGAAGGPSSGSTLMGGATAMMMMGDSGVPSGSFTQLPGGPSSFRDPDSLPLLPSSPSTDTTVGIGSVTAAPYLCSPQMVCSELESNLPQHLYQSAHSTAGRIVGASTSGKERVAASGAAPSTKSSASTSISPSPSRHSYVPAASAGALKLSMARTGGGSSDAAQATASTASGGARNAATAAAASHKPKSYVVYCAWGSACPFCEELAAHPQYSGPPALPPRSVHRVVGGSGGEGVNTAAATTVPLTFPFLDPAVLTYAKHVARRRRSYGVGGFGSGSGGGGVRSGAEAATEGSGWGSALLSAMRPWFLKPEMYIFSLPLHGVSSLKTYQRLMGETEAGVASARYDSGSLAHKQAGVNTRRKDGDGDEAHDKKSIAEKNKRSSSMNNDETASATLRGSDSVGERTKVHQSAQHTTNNTSTISTVHAQFIRDADEDGCVLLYAESVPAEAAQWLKRSAALVEARLQHSRVVCEQLLAAAAVDVYAAAREAAVVVVVPKTAGNEKERGVAGKTNATDVDNNNNNSDDGNSACATNAHVTSIVVSPYSDASASQQQQTRNNKLDDEAKGVPPIQPLVRPPFSESVKVSSSVLSIPTTTATSGSSKPRSIRYTTRRLPDRLGVSPVLSNSLKLANMLVDSSSTAAPLSEGFQAHFNIAGSAPQPQVLATAAITVTGAAATRHVVGSASTATSGSASQQQGPSLSSQPNYGVPLRLTETERFLPVEVLLRFVFHHIVPVMWGRPGVDTEALTRQLERNLRRLRPFLASFSYALRLHKAGYTSRQLAGMMESDGGAGADGGSRGALHNHDFMHRRQQHAMYDHENEDENSSNSSKDSNGAMTTHFMPTTFDIQLLQTYELYERLSLLDCLVSYAGRAVHVVPTRLLLHAVVNEFYDVLIVGGTPAGARSTKRCGGAL